LALRTDQEDVLALRWVRDEKVQGIENPEKIRNMVLWFTGVKGFFFSTHLERHTNDIPNVERCPETQWPR
jgi:hypothetical protein